ncbi:putative bifunctional diguanylate cyclase/phosphodiesterase [Paenibacillus ginsengarvi]|uniref:EAL domain-containing protein n=1 Tax=Paenibacillus ginsengarvi TaxID=400777 RepID=A0A3B0CTF1_9BACL|nr:EAL domain-containing protein [Paenibacillus ginsengarvi]RKN86971.1 EAL domain-containing protein [Paenibacillus ginsengarvi]
MNQKNAKVFALGHFIFPAVLFVMFVSQKQFILLVLALMSILFTMFLVQRAYMVGDLSQLLRMPNLAFIVFIDMAIVTLVYVLPEWHTGVSPTWLLLFLLPLYASELGIRTTLVICAFSVGEIALLAVVQGQNFFSLNTMMNVLGIIVMIIMVGSTSDNLVRMAYYDTLTKLPNREMFKDRLTSAVAKRSRKGLAVLFLDLDQFKHVNDTMGHDTGDALLRTVADRLRASLDKDIFLARMGGDEFAMLVPQVSNVDQVNQVCSAVFECLSESIMLGPHEIYATTSIGIALYPKHGTTSEALMKNSEGAMYRAKKQGRNNYQYYLPPEKTEAQMERFAMEAMLRKALEKDELLVYYQPRIHTKSEKVVCVEALVRWRHPSLGIIPPGDFIPLAEEIGLIAQLGEQVLRKACKQIKKWQDEGMKGLSVSVNLSPLQFKEQHLPGIISRILRQSGMRPEFLELEITESAAMQNVGRNILMLRELKEMGVKISIDDFGTGYSSLSYLKKFPIDSLKVDRSFISGIHQDPDDAAIVNAIIVLAKTLKLRVTAEGVETEQQYLYLQQHHCDEAQGYLFGKPMPPETFEEWYMLNTTEKDLMLSHDF